MEVLTGEISDYNYKISHQPIIPKSLTLKPTEGLSGEYVRMLS